jgi:hypothetical protein
VFVVCEPAVPEWELDLIVRRNGVVQFQIHADGWIAHVNYCVDSDVVFTTVGGDCGCVLSYAMSRVAVSLLDADDISCGARRVVGDAPADVAGIVAAAIDAYRAYV